MSALRSTRDHGARRARHLSETAAPTQARCEVEGDERREQPAVRKDSLRVLVAVAALVVVLAGLRVASRLVLTALLALFITLMVSPMARRLERMGLPAFASVSVVMLTVLTVIAGFGLLLNHSLQGTLGTLADHSDSLSELLSAAQVGLEQLGISVDEFEIANATLTDRIGSVAGGLLSLLADSVYVTVMVGFMLAESRGLGRKLDLALGQRQRRRESFAGAIARVRRYVWIKSLVSVATGVLAGLACWIAGVEAPLLWGLVAFGLNFIPMLGSLIAAIPPVLLTLVDGGIAVAVGLGGAYVAINIVMAEIVEPYVLADRIGLSPAAILLSLLFWGWVFGPLGLLLAVPFTMVLVAYCEYSEKLSWLAVLLSSSARVRDQERQAAGQRGRPPEEATVDGPAGGTGVRIAA